MTATDNKATVAKDDLVTLTIDGIETSVPKGTLIIRAAEDIGVDIPRFCDHPALKPAGACRQCLVEVAAPDREGNLRSFPAPQTACTMVVSPGMEVKTATHSEVAKRAQEGVMELLLINHPLDCPVCDKGGECPLQNQAMSHGQAESAFVDVKRVFEKPLELSTEILLDRERCILCQRCTRFSSEIAGDAFIDLQERGAQQQIGTFDTDVLDFDGYAPAGHAMEDEAGRAFSSYYSGNTVQICPVGALTSAAYRFRSRPFDLVSSPGIAEHDSSGAAIRTDHRRGTILRRLAANDPVVNEEWITDKDRFAFTWQHLDDRLERPLVRGDDGELHEASWPDALAAAAAGLTKAIRPKTKGAKVKGAAVLPGGRITMEDAYAYQKFARVVLGTNDVDVRTRPSSDEELDFLAAQVAGTGVGVTFADLEAAPAVLLAGFEPEDEGGVVFLRMRKAGDRQQVFTLAPFASRGVEKLDARLLPCAPAAEASALEDLPRDVLAALKTPGALVIVGERLATAPGALSAAIQVAESTGARLAWIPRRAGERGAADVGALPSVLPGGMQVSSAETRAALAAVWGVETLPTERGRSAERILTAAATGQLGALVVGGLTISDLPAGAKKAFAKPFVVSLEVRRSDVHEYADVVFPVAPPAEKSGTFVNWEGRLRSFPTALATGAVSDHRVLDMIASTMEVALGTATIEDVMDEFARIPLDDTHRVEAPEVSAAQPPRGVVLASWHQLIDNGSLQAGEPYLAGTARVAVARMSPATATRLGVSGTVTVKGSTRASITLPLAITEDMVDDVVWLPTNSPGSSPAATLGVTAGDVVTVKGGRRS